MNTQGHLEAVLACPVAWAGVSPIISSFWLRGQSRNLVIKHDGLENEVESDALV